MISSKGEASPTEKTNNKEASKSRIAFLESSWHEDIVMEGRKGFLEETHAGPFAKVGVDIYRVPGAFELPLHAKKLAQSGRYLAIACCGLVVDGGIYRHEFVAQAVIDGLMRVQLDTGVPVFSGVLTPHHFHEHEEHRSYFKRHFFLKGKELAQASLRTIASLNAIAETGDEVPSAQEESGVVI